MTKKEKHSNLGTDGSVDGPYTTLADKQPFEENYDLKELIECILEDIALDIDIGDVVLGGKFKNKRIVVKKTGKDNLGQPTINGKPFLKFRIEKSLPKNKQSKQTREEEADKKSKKSKKEAAEPTLTMLESLRVRKEFSRLIIEAKIDQAIQQYADNVNMSAFLEELKAANVLPKYIPWLINQAVEANFPTRNSTVERLKNITKFWIEKINRFDKMLKLNQMPVDKRDINHFGDFEDLVGWTEHAEEEYKRKTKEKRSKKEADKIYQDENYLIIEPKTEEASCVYGKGSQWCISATQSHNYFNEYAEQGARFIFIINKKTGDKDAIAFAGNIKDIEIYDAEDNTKKNLYIEEKYSKPVLDALNQFLGKVTGAGTIFTTVTLETVRNDPKILLQDDNTFNSLISRSDVFAVNIIETLGFCSKQNWTEKETAKAYEYINLGIYRLVNRIEFMNVIRDKAQLAKRLLKVYKVNKENLILTDTALKLLALYYFMSPQKETLNVSFGLPVIFNPATSKALMKFVLDNKNDISKINEKQIFTRLIEICDSVKYRIQVSIAKEAVDLLDHFRRVFTLANGQSEQHDNEAIRIIAKIDYIYRVAEKYNWDFVQGALNEI